jgi:hypothetical protein
MAAGATKADQMTDRYEALDIELRNPTVVLSVRLDEAVAKELHRWAKQRGVRVSDILRDAASQYARVGPAEVSYTVGGGLNVGIGISSVSTEAAREARQVATHLQPPATWFTGVLGAPAR